MTTGRINQIAILWKHASPARDLPYEETVPLLSFIFCFFIFVVVTIHQDDGLSGERKTGTAVCRTLFRWRPDPEADEDRGAPDTLLPTTHLLLQRDP